MIIGACPYPDCDEPFMLPIASGARFEKWNCEKCGRVIWTCHSRFDPWSMTEADFHAHYEVNEPMKCITKRDQPLVPGPRTLQ
jgi:hypothetical protein